jgi:DNA polymerase-3 subunit delta
MKATAGQLGGLLDNPRPAIRFYLFHGPDEAGALEHAARLARALGPGIERVDFEPKALRDAPGALADEAASLSLFGDKRYIRVLGADDGMAEALALLLAAERTENAVVAIAPSLKASSKLVKAAIAAPAAVAFACYVPEGADAARLAQNMAREQGLRLGVDAAQRLASATNGDRAVLAREIEKLALYLDAAPERPRDADGRALDAIGADLGEAEISGAIAAIVEGRTADVGAELARLEEAGNSPIVLLRSLTRKLMSLTEMRGEIDAGASVNDVLERHRVFFREKGSTGHALRRWTAPQLARAIDRVRAAERGMMRGGSAGEVLADAECVAIARAAAKSG